MNDLVTGRAAIALIFILTAFSGPAAASGISVGSGGNTIVCQVSQANALAGTYALDFVLTGIETDDLVPAVDVEHSFERIARILDDIVYTAPYLNYIFRSFAGDLYNTTDPSRSNYWRAVSEIDFTNDQRFDLRDIPVNCRRQEAADIRQAFVRYRSEFTDRGTETTVYQYVPQELEALQRQDPLQVSFLLVHEWLWHVSMDVVLNRQINRFLHSRAIDGMNDREIGAELRRMGLDVSRIGLATDEAIVDRGTFESNVEQGATRDEACLGPRRAYAQIKLTQYAQTCERLVPIGHASRIVTRSYREVVVHDEPHQTYSCYVNWSYVCAAAP